MWAFPAERSRGSWQCRSGACRASQVDTETGPLHGRGCSWGGTPVLCPGRKEAKHGTREQRERWRSGREDELGGVVTGSQENRFPTRTETLEWAAAEVTSDKASSGLATRRLLRLLPSLAHPPTTGSAASSHHLLHPQSRGQDTQDIALRQPLQSRGMNLCVASC